MTKPFLIAAALLLTALPVLAQTPDRGAVPEKHDSNSLHKLGNSIQYPFRKAGENVSKSTRKGAKDVQYGARKNSENLSVNAHRATGQKSVVRRKNGARRHDTIVTPKGHLHRIHKSA
ncbi:MAG: hypothetical protein ACRYFS_08830 [Janthinobacterium lividum]